MEFDVEVSSIEAGRALDDGWTSCAYCQKREGAKPKKAEGRKQRK
jgi:hypothetical protein